jgi:hypothetical protein
MTAQLEHLGTPWLQQSLEREHSAAYGRFQRFEDARQAGKHLDWGARERGCTVLFLLVLRRD